MDRSHSPSGWRAAAFAAALFAITLNFLQPLAHAALMRDGGALSWSSLCLAAKGHDERQHSTPAAATPHECCLGLAHAPALSAPPPTCVVLRPPPTLAQRPLLANEAMAPVGVRDGPAQPRGPPPLA